MLEARNTALSTSNEARLCRQHLEDVQEHMYVSLEKTTSVETTSAGAAARSRKELACLQKNLGLSRKCGAAAKCFF